MKELPLYGKWSHLSIIIDDEDLEEVSRHRWLYFKNGKNIYARRSIKVEPGTPGKWKHELLHTFLTGWPLVDHINHNGLDNRRINLRAATNAENRRNMLKRETRAGVPTSSQFKGVSRRNSRWRATLSLDRKQKFLGSFGSEVDAARAYDQAARTYFGEFAHLNFPEGVDPVVS